MGGREFDLRAALGAEEGVATQTFTIFLPNKGKRDGVTFTIDSNVLQGYIDTAMILLANINGGVTKLPSSQGIYVEEGTNIDSIGDIEDTVLVYSYIMNPGRFEQRISEMKYLMHEFGKECGQMEVMAEFFGENPDGGTYCKIYSIRHYV